MMFSALRRRMHFSPATVIASLALVLAMSGGAFAAGRYLITSTKQIKPSVLAQLKGKPGSAGAQGSQGAAGAVGPQGAAGLQGAAGPQGSQGPQGPAGPAGQNGTTGFTETLPKGKTLKGDWSIIAYLPATGFIEGGGSTGVSFGIPLAAAPEPIYVPAPTEEEENKHQFPDAPEGCTGNVEEPGAEAGHLCVFARTQYNVSEVHICSATHPVFVCVEGQGGADVVRTADRSGFLIGALDEAKGPMFLSGTWAVTAAE